MDAIKEFLGLSDIGKAVLGFKRIPEGGWSWQHLVAVSVYLVVMAVLAVVLGLRNKIALIIKTLFFVL